jgi:hypothetical protein
MAPICTKPMEPSEKKAEKSVPYIATVEESESELVQTSAPGKNGSTAEETNWYETRRASKENDGLIHAICR